MNSYQRLKKENEELRKEIYFLTLKEDSIEAFNIRLKYILQSRVEDMFMQGETTITKLNGLL